MNVSERELIARLDAAVLRSQRAAQALSMIVKEQEEATKRLRLAANDLRAYAAKERDG